MAFEVVREWGLSLYKNNNIIYITIFINLTISKAFLWLKMERFMNKEIEDLVKGVGVPQGLGDRSGKIKNNDFSEEMVKLNKLYQKVINNTEYLKCLLVLSLKKVTWYSELREKFDCSDSIINYFTSYMKENGLIVTKQLIDLDDILYETIIKTNPTDFYRQSTKVNLITLTPEGEEFSKRIVGDCVKLQRGDIIFTIQEINNKTLAFRKKYDEILCLENKLTCSNEGSKIIDGYRHIKYPDGTIIMKETELKKKLLTEIKKGLVEHKQQLLLQKQEQGLLTHKQSQQLTILNENKNDLIVFDNIDTISKKDVYNGLYSHLNSIEIDKLVLGVSKEEESGAGKEYQEEIKAKSQYYSKDNTDISKDSDLARLLNRVPETEEQEIKAKRECLGFLNSLTPCD